MKRMKKQVMVRVKIFLIHISVSRIVSRMAHFLIEKGTHRKLQQFTWKTVKMAHELAEKNDVAQKLNLCNI